MEKKSTFKTTEFWLAGVLPQVMALACLFGVVNPTQSAALQGAAGELVGGVLSLGGAIGYGVSRGLAKKQ